MATVISKATAMPKASHGQLQGAMALAAADPVIARLVKEHGVLNPTPKEHASPYEALVRSVVFQQLSGKAATTILGRVVALFDADFPLPQHLIDAPDEALRGAGLSAAKTRALKDIARCRLERIIPDLREIAHLGDDEIITRLTAPKGVGRWTVEMYLMFTLGRPDVFPADDLGVRRGVHVAYGEDHTPKSLAVFGERFAPWRTSAALLLWRAADSTKVKPVETLREPKTDRTKSKPRATIRRKIAPR
jgi:DNA-3-methyladenine glycosylase II